MNEYLQATTLLNYNHETIQQLIDKRRWKNLGEKEKIKSIYDFVRDEIFFGYNKSDDIPASQVLKDGCGQCNTKSTLLMALLRAVGVSCRFHGFTINKALQKGAISGLWYFFAPANIVHSWVEVKYNGRWCNLEGVIIDKQYLSNLQQTFKSKNGVFCGYGVFTDNFENPQIDWDENDTYIQKLGINQDFGIFNNPDEFYKLHRQELSPFKLFVFNLITRNIMNNNVQKIRQKSS